MPGELRYPRAYQSGRFDRFASSAVAMNDELKNKLEELNKEVRRFRQRSAERAVKLGLLAGLGESEIAKLFEGDSLTPPERDH